MVLAARRSLRALAPEARLLGQIHVLARLPSLLGVQESNVVVHCLHFAQSVAQIFKYLYSNYPLDHDSTKLWTESAAIVSS
jgi:hypothetical protein